MPCALSTCELLVTGWAILFPNMYRQFMEYLADGNIDIVGVCVLIFLGNEFGELLTSFCSDKRIGTVTFPLITVAVHPFPRTVIQAF